MAEARLDLKHVGILMASHAKYAVRGGSGITFVLIVVVLGPHRSRGFLIDPLDGRPQGVRAGQRAASIPRDQFIGGSSTTMKPLISGFWLGKPPEDPQVDVPAQRPAGPALGDVPDPARVRAVRDGLRRIQPAERRHREPRAALPPPPHGAARTSSSRGSSGRFLFSALTSLFTIAVIVAYLAMRYDIYPVGDLATWGLYGWAALNLFSLPYLALCTWISTSVASPFGALALCPGRDRRPDRR